MVKPPCDAAPGQVAAKDGQADGQREILRGRPQFELTRRHDTQRGGLNLEMPEDAFGTFERMFRSSFVVYPWQANGVETLTP